LWVSPFAALAAGDSSRAADDLNAIVARFDHSEKVTYDQAVDELVRVGPAAVSPLIDVLKNSKCELARMGAAEALGRIGTEAGAANSALAAVLENKGGHEDGKVRRAAAVALGRIGLVGPHQGRVVPALHQALSKDEDECLKDAAAEALGQIGPEASEAVPGLRLLLKCPSPALCYHAAEALGKVGSGATAAVGELADSLGRPETQIRRAAANALRQIGPEARAAFSALDARLTDDNWEVRRAVIDALAQIGPRLNPDQKGAVRTKLSLLLRSGRQVHATGTTRESSSAQEIPPEVLRSAANALKEIGPGKNVVDDLKQWARDHSDWEVQRACIDALAQVGPSAMMTSAQPPRLIHVLIELLREKGHWEIRRSAADALRSVVPDVTSHAGLRAGIISQGIESDSRDAVRALITALEVESEDPVRRSAADALAALAQAVPEEEAREAGNALFELWKNTQSNALKRSAVVALYRIRQADRIPPKKLISLLDPEMDELIRQAAADALAQIRADAPLEEANEAVNRLKGLLAGETRDKSYVVRLAAAVTLRKIGERAQHAAQELVDALENDEHYEVRRSAAQALVEIGPGAALELAQFQPNKCQRMFEVLIRALGDEDWFVRRSAAEALALIGPQVITPLKEVFADPKASPKDLIKQNAAEVLGRIDPWDSEKGRIDPGAQDILPILAGSLNDTTLMGPPKAFAADAMKSAIPRFAAKAHALTREDLVALKESVHVSLSLADRALPSVPNQEVRQALRDIESKLKKRENELTVQELLAWPFANNSNLLYCVLSLSILLGLSVFGLKRFLNLRRRQHPAGPRHGLTGGVGELVKALPENSSTSHTNFVGARGAIESGDQLRKPVGQQHAQEQPAAEATLHGDLPRNAVFISYAWEDRPAVAQLVAGLKAEGLSVWFDEDRLKPGDNYDPKIEQYISRDCSCLVAVISQNTERQPCGYFRREWSLAVERSKSFYHELRFIVPVIVDDTAKPVTVPREFERRTYSRLLGGTVTKDFVDAIKQTVRIVTEAEPAGLLD
jgi:HEAT repeat protein